MQLRSASMALALSMIGVPACVTDTDSTSGAVASDLAGDAVVVATDKGLVKGAHAGSGFAFLGVPYAKPPLGALRFQPPVPAARWSGVADATAFGHTCVQIGGDVVAAQEVVLNR
jgi:para-nitrobenzyl esterase